MNDVLNQCPYVPVTSYWIGDFCVYFIPLPRKVSWVLQRGQNVVAQGKSSYRNAFEDVLEAMRRESADEVTE